MIIIFLRPGILELTINNGLLFQSVFFRFILENPILKFENNCQIYDVTNRLSPFSQQSSPDVLRISMYIFTSKYLIQIKDIFSCNKLNINYNMKYI